MAKPQELPLLEQDVDDTAMTGVMGVSLVDLPANQTGWVALRDHDGLQPVALVVTPGTKQRLTGPLLIPGQKILRVDEKTGEQYNIAFSAEAIERIAEKYPITGQAGRTTTMHLKANDRVRVVESWLIEDPKKDKAAAMGFKLPKGTWMATVKVEDTAYWNRNIKTGKLKGFSIEGIFNQTPQAMAEKNALASALKGATADQRAELRKALDDLDKAEKPTLGQRLLSAFGLAETKEKDKEEMAMTVMLPDGTALDLPDSNEVEVMDSDGNVVGRLVFTPAETAPVEAPQDGEAPAASPNDVAMKAEVAALKAQVAALKAQAAEVTEALEQLAQHTPRASVKAAAVAPAGAAHKGKPAADPLPGAGQPPANGLNMQEVLAKRQAKTTKTA